MADGEIEKPAVSPDTPARGNQEAFVSRWSRLKEEARHAPPQPAPQKAANAEGPVPELPPLENLTLDSDYRAFFHPKVGEDVRRAALKRLFSDPHFNVMDGLDVYIDDYSKNEPIPPAMLAGLRQAQKILEWAKEDEEQRKKEEQPQVAVNRTPELPTEPSGPNAGLQAGAPEAVPATPDGAGTPAGS